MNFLLCIIAFFLGSGIAWFLGQSRAVKIGGKSKIHGRVSDFGNVSMVWMLVAASAILVTLNNFTSLSSVPIIAISLFLGLFLTFFLVQKFFTKRFHAREHLESWILSSFKLCSLVTILISVLILVAISFQAFRFFEHVNIIDFLFGTIWNPSSGEGEGSYGIIPLIFGTMMISIIAMFVAAPVGLLAAIYLSEYAPTNMRQKIKPVLELLAGVPTVVYGYSAATTFGPFIREFAAIIGLESSAESALSAGIVMGVMIIPLVMSLSDDVMNSVPKSLREASIGLGATESETIRKVVIPGALPGIAGALILAFSRAIGETMIVVMAAGLAGNLTVNPLESVTTVTVQIVMLLVGDTEFDSPRTLAAFGLSLMLFLFTFALNIFAMWIVDKYRERYE